MARLNYRRGSALDPALAGFAAVSLAFAAFAMPDAPLTRLVAATGLPDILAAAQPPLGMKARLGIALFVALLSFGLFFAILRRLDGPAEREPEVWSADPEVAPEPIRLRRADAHPDAPARRPLVARDLGEPAFDDEPLHQRPPAAAVAEEELLLDVSAEAPLPPFLVPQEPEAEAAPAGESETHSAAAPEPPIEWPAREVPACEAPAVVEPAPEPAEPAPQVEGDESISRLMKRLEFGLARRERTPPVDPAAVAAPAPDAVGHRLRSAIADLEKLAARG